MAKLPCPPDLWPAFSALLDQALELPEQDRQSWLGSLGTEHAAVRPWLLRVIAHDAGTVDDSFMKRPTADTADASDFHEGQRVGPYVLDRRLGSGGMGEVWLATRSDGVLNRQVALKLPYVQLIAGVVRRRFERERDILADLSHPHIAQLYDAGVADSEHPYLAMEWVDGVAINEHCRTARLTLDRRLDLFLQILDAVGYAHGRLVAHRDLKPSNILVTSHERVKLLDFGIAKLLVGDTEAGATQLTRIGSCVATPAYAAPEQLAGEPVTVAVDVYALGVVLHELLTGRRPVRNHGPAPGDPTDVRRASSQIAAGYAAEVGGLEDRKLRRALSGDLDAIIAKALERDPQRRYRSAQAFAEDIERNRRHLPISARRISLGTLALKFAQRHWVGAGMTALLLLALLGGSAGIAWQAVRAEREAQRATSIKDFLIGVFRLSDPRIAADKPRGEITARELLDASSQQIESAFGQHPETQVELLGVTAEIYRELDETARSTALYERETELASRYLGSADAHVVDGLLGQAYNAYLNGDNSRALQLLAQADPRIRRDNGQDTVLRARWLLIRGEAVLSDATRSDEAKHDLEAAAALFQKVAPHDLRYPDALSELGNLALERSQFSESAMDYRRAIAVTDPDTRFQGDLLWPTAGLALALEDLGDVDGASAAFAQGSRIAEATYGKSHPSYWAIASDRAEFLYDRGERQAALEQFDSLMPDLPDGSREFRNATDMLEVAQVLRKFGRCLATDGQGDRAIQLLERARALLAKSASRPTDAGHLQLDLGAAYEAAGRTTEAREAFLAALSDFEAHAAPAPQLATVHEHWGRFLLAQRDTDAAAREFQESLRLSNGRATPAATYAQAGIAAVAGLRHDVAGALQASNMAMTQLEHIEGPYNVRLRPYVWTIRAEALLAAGGTGNAGAALELARRVQEATSRYYAANTAPATRATRLLQLALAALSPN